MNLARHHISSTSPVHIFDTRLDADSAIFTTSTPTGFAIYRTWPLQLIRKREITGGTLALVVPVHSSSLIYLVGGGRSPRYPPNKVILWDDALGAEVAELEFRERVRGLACRRGWLAVALRRRTVVFQVGEQLTRYGEWDTCDNPKGILTLATGAYSTLLAIPGRQLGHVQLIHLPPCEPPTPLGPPPPGPPAKPPPPPSKQPVAIIQAHSSAIASLSVPPSGRLLATTSSRGTLVRTWDAITGKPVREFRRGSDKANIYGVAFRPDERELCVWSDKGTVHVFAIAPSGSPNNRQSTFSPLTPYLPFPKYFDSEWSYAQYRIPTQNVNISLSSVSQTRSPTAEDAPEEERCVVGWIQVPVEPTGTKEYQLIALTFTGGWYRLGLPKSTPSQSNQATTSSTSGGPPPSIRLRSESGSSIASLLRDKGKEKDKDSGKEKGRDCILHEYRKYGRWDGWG